MDDKNRENEHEKKDLERKMVLSIMDLQKNPKFEDELDAWGDFEEDIEENVDIFFQEIDRFKSLEKQVESLKYEFMLKLLPPIIEDWDKKSEDQKRKFVERITLDESLKYCEQYEEWLEGRKEET